MLLEAKHRISLIFEDVEKELNSKNNAIALERLNELRNKVNESMAKYDDLRKWDSFKKTLAYNTVVDGFVDSFWNDFPQMRTACAYYQRPCFFNED